jgi:hypothetical protein
LFQSDAGTGHIFEYTPGGTKSTFASLPAYGNGTMMLAFQGIVLPVPEPSVVGLLSIGAGGLFIQWRRFRNTTL